MKRYKPYQSYKVSGLSWLGEIPEHWNVKRLGQFFEERRQKVSDKDFEPLSVTMNGIVPQLENAAKTDAGDNRKLVLKNDFVINSRSDRKGSAGTSGFIGSVSLISIVMEPKRIHPRFAHHLLRSYPFQEEFYRYGKGIVADLWSTNSSEMKNILIPDVPEDESVAIANFLDFETAKIDTLIEKQQKLIRLLKEKRQAVISHAVTKGLNPEVPMKDSGVAWLKQVPAHWDVCLIKYKCSEITDGAHISPETEGGEYYFVSIKDIKSGVINFDGALLTSEKSYEYLVKTGCMPFSGDILFSKDGTIGQTAITPKATKFVVASSLIIIRPNRDLAIPSYLDFLLQSALVKEQVESFVKGAALRRLSIQNLMKVFGVFPPIDEQNRISSYIQAQVLNFQLLEDKAYEQVKLLQERRTALISAAVTGKIDVRNWQPTDNKNIEEVEVTA